MTSLPGGTVTFFFSDLEGSTRLLQELGAEQYAATLAEHRRAVRAACASHGGVEVDTQGDAFFLAFPTARGAIEVARDIAAGLVTVRIGLHTGTPLVTGEGYVGEDVHRAARIAAAAHGGQVVVSAATAALAEADLRDLGSHRLKDLSAPERLYQLGPGEFPPLRTLSATNLPVPATPFLGRERELAELADLVARPELRLVTLTGPGGTGKSRLALQAAGAAADAFPDGVFWVSLAAIRDPALVLEAAARELGARDGLDAHVGGGRVLVLFDNFEQVLDAATEVAELLGACPNLQIVVTSREPLRLAGEQEYPVPPFAHDEGVDFFLARARSIRPALAADPAVPDICRRLDSLPLALELAAARVNVLTPSQILERLAASLPLLTAGARDAPERQRTLRATIEWSHEFLAAAERGLFRRLAVFTGGFTLEAAEAVCDADLDTLGLLVDKSLVRRTDERFVLLETIREYAEEQVVAAGDLDELRRRHAAYFVGFAERAAPELTGERQALWLERIARDHENLRAALQTLDREGDRESMLRLSSSLVLFWFVRGFYAEGIDWLGRAAAPPRGTSEAAAAALWGLGLLEVLRGDDGGEQHLVEALGRARELGARQIEARSLSVLGLVAFFRNEPGRAQSQLEDSVEVARAADDRWCLADALGTLSSIYPLYGRLDDARPAGEEALALARGMHEQQGIRMALFGLALEAIRREELGRARTLGEEGLAICREIGDQWFISYFLWLLALASLGLAQSERARHEADEALTVGREVGGALLVVCALEVLARLELAAGDLGSARVRLDEALAVAEAGVPASYVAAVYLTRGMLARAGGDADGARSELERSREVARASGDTWAEAAARAALDVL